MQELCVEFAGERADIARARHFVAATLHEWGVGSRVDDAVLVTSELVTNVVLHSRTPLRLTVRLVEADVVRIEVYDENTRLPVSATPPLDATSGRGLVIVGELSTTWGTRSHGDGKTVWAQLGETAVDEPDCVDLSGADGSA